LGALELVHRAFRSLCFIPYQTQNPLTTKAAAETMPWLNKPMKMLNGRMILVTSLKTI
jgi:hypothetical protein